MPVVTRSMSRRQAEKGSADTQHNSQKASTSPSTKSAEDAAPADQDHLLAKRRIHGLCIDSRVWYAQRAKVFVDTYISIHHPRTRHRLILSTEHGVKETILRCATLFWVVKVVTGRFLPQEIFAMIQGYLWRYWYDEYISEESLPSSGTIWTRRRLSYSAGRDFSLWIGDL